MTLSDEQQAFVEAEGKVVLCACPGSGKTFTVAHKLSAYMNTWTEKHKGVAVLSFTNVASSEIENKTKQVVGTGINLTYPHFIGTIDSFLNQFIFLKYAYLLTQKYQRPYITQNYIDTYFKWDAECHSKGCVSRIQDFRWDIDNKFYKNNDLVECESRNKCAKYKMLLIKNNIFFQNDVAFTAYNILKKYPQIAKMLANRFPVILLDEAQDTSKEQIAILDLIVNAGVETICLVGDPDQSIYEWRNATASCFIEKMNSKEWKTLYLTENRRSSKKICNATKLFSTILEDEKDVDSVGADAEFSQKPQLLLTTKDTSKDDVMTYFLSKCEELGIEHNKENVAVLTRGKIHKNTDIANIWKSNEIELLAKASYLWKYKSKREAYNLCAKCLYIMLIGSLHEAQNGLDNEIEKKISKEVWKRMCLKLLVRLPSVELGVGEWVNAVKELFHTMDIQLEFNAGHTIDEVIKIKKYDKNNKEFKYIPVRMFFESRSEDNVTISSIHGVKGETFEAILLYAPSTTGNTITRSGITQGLLNSEHNRAAYVAMTRPRKYLAVALRKPSKKSDLPLKRFPEELWDYIEL